MKFYKKEIEELMLNYFQDLNEPQKRQYAAIEVKKLSHGGLIYISRLLSISENTIKRGLKELEIPGYFSQFTNGKERKAGGGRKKKKNI